MIYETLGNDTPKATPKDSGGVWGDIATGVLDTASSLIDAISAKKQQERMAQTAAEMQQVQNERIALENRLQKVLSSQSGDNTLLIVGGITALTLVLVLVMKK